MNRGLAKLVTAGSCLLIALAATLAFLAVAMLMGRYTPIDLYVGATWVFIISLIVAVPFIIPLLRKRRVTHEVQL